MTLHEYIAGARPFCWRTNHCAHFAAGWAAPHVDLPALPGPAGVRAALRQMGVRSVREAVSRVLGPELPTPALAQPGDVVLFGRALGLCDGRYAALLNDAGGMSFAAMEHASAAWRVRR